MTLGERIASLRNEKRMSQGELAEKLNVSRQSVSKWETDASIPELDKIIQLCELFHISMDELVRGEGEEPSAKEETQAAVMPEATLPPKAISTQKIIGFILFAVGAFCVALGLFAVWGLFYIGLYVLMCGVICIFVKRYAGLIIGWGTLLLFAVLTPYFTGIRLFSVLRPEYYRNGISMIQIITFAMWATFFLLCYVSICAWKKHKSDGEEKHKS